ncbi:MAG: fasciclin domain-containing protein [Prevotella sp.]|nr:fasciclin domain-containing protein [Prevotella sp.]
MTRRNYFKHAMKAVAVLLASTALLASCKEDIDESNLYTFTGETIEDFLTNRSDEYSSFNYILTRIGYDKILSAYGMYTCFAPNNQAVEAYIDSLYDDVSNADLPHNGMTARGLEGLTDSLCKDIALFHLLYTEVMGVNMSNGMTLSTMLGRDINTSIDSISGLTVINRYSAITGMDNELENGVLHEIDHVLQRSNRFVSGEMAENPELFSLFSQALIMTGLADSLTAQKRTDFEEVTSTYNFYVPEECALGYTIFAETDEAFAANGIRNMDDLIAFANKEYADCAKPGSGWYDYYRNKGVEVSTGTDYTNPANTLNMFVRYHILKCKVSYDKLVRTFNEVSKVTLYEYYETMLPNTLFKISRISGKRLINRWVTNSTLTDRVGEEASASIQTVMREGVEVQTNNIQALNGYLHPIKDMLVYDVSVPRGVLNERMRFDDTAIVGEMMSNNFRMISDTEVRALNGGKSGSDGALGGDYIRCPNGFFENLVIYNGNNTRLYYLAGQSNGWSNYQGDEFNCMGAYDFAFRLPPVPDGTYELRMGYTANGNRGMLQFYLGRTPTLSDMKALDIPLDMRHVPSNQTTQNNGVTTYSPDVVTGWLPYLSTEDMGIESDANMHNLGWMRGPLYYTVGKGGSTVARANAQDLRRIITRQQFEQGDYWLRFKTVLPDNTNCQFHLDYIELCPENVYNNPQYVEDMY